MQTEPPPSQLTGVIIGAAVVVVSSLLTFLGSLLNSWLTGRREAKQWTRQQKADEAKSLREEKLEEKKQRRLIAHNVLARLSHLMSIDETETPELQAQRSSLVTEAITELTHLSIQYHTSENSKVLEFDKSLKSFIHSPSRFTTGLLRDAVSALIMEDKILFPEGVPLIETKVPEEKPKEPALHFAMQIDDDFRREQVINEGIPVPRIYNFASPLSQLTQSQRELLADIYFSQHREIPGVVNLPMPTPTSPGDGRWRGKINPTEDNHADVLKLWEQDYRDAQNKLNESTDS